MRSLSFPPSVSSHPRSFHWLLPDHIAARRRAWTLYGICLTRSAWAVMATVWWLPALVAPCPPIPCLTRGGLTVAFLPRATILSVLGIVLGSGSFPVLQSFREYLFYLFLAASDSIGPSTFPALGGEGRCALGGLPGLAGFGLTGSADSV